MYTGWATVDGDSRSPSNFVMENVLEAYDSLKGP